LARRKEWTDQDTQRQSRSAERRQPFRGLRIAKTAVGKGLFASRAYVDGEVIGEITGETISDPDYTSRYAFDLENGSQLEPEAPFRYVNHSCDPNCSFEVLEVKQGASNETRRQLMLFAIDAIRSGDELTIDYNWPAGFAIPCKCGSDYCRGWIVGSKYLRSADEPVLTTSRA
jgi:uncharacterized protein